jgi:hypothetical protein
MPVVRRGGIVGIPDVGSLKVAIISLADSHWGRAGGSASVSVARLCNPSYIDSAYGLQTPYVGISYPRNIFYSLLAPPAILQTIRNSALLYANRDY